MEKLVLGFDTSCYTTSAALVNLAGEVIASSRLLLPVSAGERGLRQSEAVFAHIKQMPRVMEGLTASLPEKPEICAVCVSGTPRDGEDSYMPVFLAGYSHAKAVAETLRVPLYVTSHQRGHIAAGWIGGQEPEGSYAALHLSGGTTELLLNDGKTLSLIGGSRDLHAGQLLDRMGVAMGFPFPAGAALEKLALSAEKEASALIPVSMEEGGLFCHLSGAENKAVSLREKEGMPDAQVARELFDFLSRTIVRMLDAAQKRHRVDDFLIVGGVASSLLLREMILRRAAKLRGEKRIHFGPKEFSSDNAAGVACIGARRYLMETEEKA